MPSFINSWRKWLCYILYIFSKTKKILEKNNITVHFEKRKEMTHNQFDIYKDIIETIKKFIDSNKIIMDKKIPNEIKNEEINK